MSNYHPIILQLFQYLGDSWCDIHSYTTMAIFIKTQSDIEKPWLQWHQQCQYTIQVDVSIQDAYCYNIVHSSGEILQRHRLQNTSSQDFIEKIIQIHNDYKARY